MDASGRVIGALGEGTPDGPLEGPGIERVELPGGGFLIARRPAVTDAWTRYSRAFIHDARSPLNALAIYLELLATRLTTPPPKDRPESSPERILSKASDQIRRIEELLRSFGELWGARGETTNLSEMTAAVARFSEHEAHRLGLTFSADVAPNISVPTPPAHMAEALVLLLGAVFRAPQDTHIHVRLAAEGEKALLAVDVQAEPATAAALLRPGADSLRGAGGFVEMKGRQVTALFARLGA